MKGKKKIQDLENVFGLSEFINPTERVKTKIKKAMEGEEVMYVYFAGKIYGYDKNGLFAKSGKLSRIDKDIILRSITSAIERSPDNQKHIKDQLK